MPWKATSKEEQRFDLVRQLRAGLASVTVLAQRFRISRQTLYKWRDRYRRSRLRGLQDQSRRPHSSPGQTGALWLRRVRRFRQSHPTWGARKLRHELIRRFNRLGAPSPATINRWLKRWGLSRGRPRRPRGPVLTRKVLRAARRCHEVWTVDFKGWYRTGAGVRVEPLTVRDLFSRYGLRIALLRSPSIAQTRPAFAALFAEYGLPERIRCDNGAPFGGAGPTGLTRLSAWWIKLGIEVEFITPGRPGENGAHEQFHRVYKAEVAARPARTVKEEQKRSDVWLRHYNQERPHEALAMRRPAEVFQANARRPLRKKIEAWPYPAGWERCWVKGNGEISFRGVRRYVGEAFVRDYLGLKPKRRGVWRVYFGPVLVGELHEKERGSIRMAKYARAG
jgi:transposase InsO family protein